MTKKRFIHINLFRSRPTRSKEECTPKLFKLHIKYFEVLLCNIFWGQQSQRKLRFLRCGSILNNSNVEVCRRRSHASQLPCGKQKQSRKYLKGGDDYFFNRIGGRSKVMEDLKYRLHHCSLYKLSTKHLQAQVIACIQRVIFFLLAAKCRNWAKGESKRR